MFYKEKIEGAKRFTRKHLTKGNKAATDLWPAVLGRGPRLALTKDASRQSRPMRMTGPPCPAARSPAAGPTHCQLSQSRAEDRKGSSQRTGEVAFYWLEQGARNSRPLDDPRVAGVMGTSEAAQPPFARVAPALFIGNARAAGATELLVRAGITLCVNVSRQQPGPRAPGVADLRVPVFDDPAEDLLTHLEPTCAAMEAAVRDGGSCLVYCKNGRSRSAAVCTAYLMRHRGHSLDRAFQVRATRGGSFGAGPTERLSGSSGGGASAPWTVGRVSHCSSLDCRW